MPISALSRRVVPGLAAVALLGAACGSDSGGVEATAAWARPSPMMADAGAAYMVLSSDEAVSVVSASVPDDIAGLAELHETVPVDASMDDDSMDDDSMDEGHEGMGDMAMTMQEVTSIDIPAGGEVALAPGGLHVMLLNLPAPFEIGQEFDVTFTQDDGETFVVTVEVREEAP